MVRKMMERINKYFSRRIQMKRMKENDRERRTNRDME